MTKKAQFIIPNVFIKEAFGAGITRGGLMQVGQLLTRANKGPATASLHRALQSGVRRGNPIEEVAVKPLFKELRAAGTTRGSVSRNELAAKLRAVRAGKTTPKTSAPPPLPKTSTPPPLPNTASVEESALFRYPLSQRTAANTAPQMRQADYLPSEMAYKPGLLNRANRALSSTTGRVALPIATGAVGYGFGNSSGYDEGFGQGSLSAQQMAAIQAMQAQQQARQMYDNQGFLDRLMGNNPF
jgi:hypothetical protein